jgi:hypothetical protein
LGDKKTGGTREQFHEKQLNISVGEDLRKAISSEEKGAAQEDKDKVPKLLVKNISPNVNLQHIKEIFGYYITMDSVYFVNRSSCIIETAEIELGQKLHGTWLDGMQLEIVIE